MAKKITKATLKSFIRKNRENLHIMGKSSFDGMIDGTRHKSSPKFSPIQPANRKFENNLNIAGLWLVGSSRDSFSHFENDEFVGIEIYNCCGNSVLAVKKN